MQLVQVYRQLVSESPRCTPACVREATCELASIVCIGSSLRLVTSATLAVLERSHTVARLVIQNSTCRSVQDLCKRCQCRSSRYRVPCMHLELTTG